MPRSVAARRAASLATAPVGAAAVVLLKGAPCLPSGVRWYARARPRRSARSAGRLCGAARPSDNAGMKPRHRLAAPSVRARLVRTAAALVAALALPACANLEFQWANTGSPAKLERRMLDLYDPMSPVNVWNVF
jgi:hypothetical protein